MPSTRPTDKPPGTLYVVATPLGNLADISQRALETLQNADLVVCEDTRHTRKLLTRHNIRTPMASCHEHNEKQKAPALVEKLKSGQTLALVSDAGTPLLSDPGFSLVSLAAGAGILVSPVPGPFAGAAALSVAGLATDRFFFEGFLPQKKGPRSARISELAGVPATLVFYESPRRVRALAAELFATLGDRPAALCRELTKLHEEVIRLPLSGLAKALADAPEVRGECVVLVAGAQLSDGPEDPRWPEALAQALEGGMSVSRAAAFIASWWEAPKSEVYALALKLAQASD